MQWFMKIIGFGGCEKTKPIYRPLDGNPKHVERVRLKKQSQFPEGQN